MDEEFIECSVSKIVEIAGDQFKIMQCDNGFWISACHLAAIAYTEAWDTNSSETITVVLNDRLIVGDVPPPNDDLLVAGKIVYGEANAIYLQLADGRLYFEDDITLQEIYARYEYLLDEEDIAKVQRVCNPDGHYVITIEQIDDMVFRLNLSNGENLVMNLIDIMADSRYSSNLYASKTVRRTILYCWNKHLRPNSYGDVVEAKLGDMCWKNSSSCYHDVFILRDDGSVSCQHLDENRILQIYGPNLPIADLTHFGYGSVWNALRSFWR